MLAKRQDADKKIKVVDVNKAESEIEALEIVTLAAVIDGLKEKFPGLKHHRIPICNSAAPSEKDFDNLCAALLGHNINCPGHGPGTSVIKIVVNLAYSQYSHKVLRECQNHFWKVGQNSIPNRDSRVNPELRQ